MTLLDFHRLRQDEERSWDRERLRADAGPEFCDAVERLLPQGRHPWRSDQYSHIDRAGWFPQGLELCARYRAANPVQRAWLRSRVDRPICGHLSVFGLQAAVLAARETSPDGSRASLIAFAIADLTDNDVRDVLIGVALLSHCATLAGAQVAELFRDAADLSGAAMSALYRDWADRYPQVQSIQSMGWSEVHTDEGIAFRH